MYCVCLMEDDQARRIPAVDGDGKRAGKKRAPGKAVEEVSRDC